jgi:hypothetical protein
MSAIDEIDWAALQPGDADPEPLADGEACGVYVLHVPTGMQFDCTRPPHEDDPQHVSCAWWGSMRPEDSVVVATWQDEPDGSVTAVETITPEQMTRINERAGVRRDRRMRKGSSR